MTEAGRDRSKPPDTTPLSDLRSSELDPTLGTADPMTRALEAYIEASLEQLLHGQAGMERHGLIFLST